MKDLLEEAARAMGLIPAWAPLKPLEEAERRFRAWLEAGRHGGMAYLRRPEERFWPEKRFPWAKSALLLFAPYAYEDPGRPPGGLRVGRIARYAWSRDYHLVLGEALGALAALARSLGLEARGYVDHGPLPERALAVLSGAGWVGKSGMFLSQAFGVHAFIGVLLTPLEVEAPPLHPSRCGRCVRCLQACPTGALLGDGTLDARICISYLRVLLDPNPWGVKKEGVLWTPTGSTPSTILTQRLSSWLSTSGWTTSSRPFRPKASSSPKSKSTRRLLWPNS